MSTTSPSPSSSPSPSPPLSLYARTRDATLGLLRPWVFMSLSLSYAPRALLDTLRGSPSPSPSRSPFPFSSAWRRRFRDLWFGRFWAAAGPGVRSSAEANVAPLLEGRVAGGRVVDDSAAGPGVSGVVLEIGAGGGTWVDLFARRRTSRDSGDGDVITRIYGVEPSADQHASLRRAVREAGLEDVYEIVPVGIEDLGGGSSGSGSNKKWEGGGGGGGGRIEKGSVDCIVSILCLCSIPDPERNIRELYGYLREGGRWYVFEHVRCEYSWYMRLYQRFVNIFWPHFIGGCLLCRPTEKTLREVGPWTKIDVGLPPDTQWFHLVPHILGVFTK
ncbi:S-adenosyl-L-methionine-dependent methyltransferase [Biscogniauxia marginata]|nr:S-adenosyl-L-methionine-dependent methyltransferase [Biscogniauxia marginata]